MLAYRPRMPAPQHDRRADVLDAARSHGWTHRVETTSLGAITDEFRREAFTLICFWSTTPWSPNGHWDNGVLYTPDGPRQVWRITKDDGVLAVLEGPSR